METDKLKDRAVTTPKLEKAFEWVDNAGTIQKDTTATESYMLAYKKNQNLDSEIATSDQQDQWVHARLGDVLELKHSSFIGTNANTRRTNFGIDIKDGVIRRRHVNSILDLDNFMGLAMFGAPKSNSIGSNFNHRNNFRWIKYAPNEFPNVEYSDNTIAINFQEHRNSHIRDITHILVRTGRKTGLTTSTSVSTFLDLATQDGVSGLDAGDGEVYNEIMVPLYAPYEISASPTPTVITSAGETYQYYNLAIPTNRSVAIRLSNLNFSSGNRNYIGLTPATNNVNQLSNPNEIWISFHAVRGIGG